ncbi:MAG TPA: hypothetical protein VGH14_02605 [Solirubrobacterales bacterium]|jgi:archaellum component FlaC
METMTEITTDKRIEELRNEMHRGFEKVDTEIREVRLDINDLRSEVKGDINGLRSDVKGDTNGLRSDVKGDINGLRSELKGDISELRSEMKSGFARSDAKFDSLNRTIILLLGGALSTLVAGLITVAFTALS